jgi:hypothetical protein
VVDLLAGAAGRLSAADHGAIRRVRNLGSGAQIRRPRRRLVVLAGTAACQRGGGRCCSARIWSGGSSGSWRRVELRGGSAFGGSGPRRPARLVAAVLVGRVGSAGLQRAIVAMVLLHAVVGNLEVGGVGDARASLGVGGGQV